VREDSAEGGDRTSVPTTGDDQGDAAPGTPR
jgi:hypothetical protein